MQHGGNVEQRDGRETLLCASSRLDHLGYLLLSFAQHEKCKNLGNSQFMKNFTEFRYC